MLNEALDQDEPFKKSFLEEFQMRAYKRDVYHLKRKGALWKLETEDMRQKAERLRTTTRKKICSGSSAKASDKEDDEVSQVSESATWTKCDTDEVQPPELEQVEEEKGKEEAADQEEPARASDEPAEGQ